MPLAVACSPFSQSPKTLIDAFLPLRPRTVAADTLLIAGASLFVAACARVVIPLPFTPVPITGQTFAVLLTGMLLGSRRGALALLLYLAEGAAGLPVFSGGGTGIYTLMGPTGGYLWSYPWAAALVGCLAERGWDRRPHGAASAMALGSLLILILGSLWLSCYVGGIASGFLRGMAPFVVGDILKIMAASALVPVAWSLVQRFRGSL